MILPKSRRLYLIPVLSKALDILESLQAAKQPMTLEAIHRETKISKTTVYRVLKTYVHRGLRVRRSQRGGAVFHRRRGEPQERSNIDWGRPNDSRQWV